MLDIRDRIIVALDVDSRDAANEIVRQLHGKVGAFKVGLQLFAAAGPGFVRELTSAGNKVFLDLKFHDIPNTVAKASIEAARMGVWMFNIHASGGSEMMRTVIKDLDSACDAEGISRPLVIGVTVLTSSNKESMNETGVAGEVEDQVVKLALLSAGCGLDGVVASPLEVEAIRRAIPDRDFVTVTPGIRAKSATPDDQKRVTTVSRALAAGSDYVVIGRPVTQAADMAAAVEMFVTETEKDR